MGLLGCKNSENQAAYRIGVATIEEGICFYNYELLHQHSGQELVNRIKKLDESELVDYLDQNNFSYFYPQKTTSYKCQINSESISIIVSIDFTSDEFIGGKLEIYYSKKIPIAAEYIPTLSK